MSVVRLGRSIACACSSCGNVVTRSITSSFVVQKNITPEQAGFEGLSSGVIYDDKHGYGYDKEGKLVIVTPKPTTFTKVSTGTASNIETEILLDVAKQSYPIQNKVPANDFKVPICGSLSDDETEYFLNAAKESYTSTDNKKTD